MDDEVRETYARMFKWAEQSERPGGELDWFAIDSDGYIAAFTTAGDGPVPDALFTIGLEKYLRLVELIEGKSNHAHSIFMKEFEAYWERGLYVYDHQDWRTGLYELIATPEVPIRIAEVLSLGFESQLFVPFSGLFLNTVNVNPKAHWPCR